MTQIEHRSQNPAPLLVQHLPSLPKGLALDIASGYGRNAFFLASKGYEVKGYDRNEEAVAYCNEKARRQNLLFSAVCVDLEKEIPFQEGTYNLVTCFYYLDRKIIPMIKNTLRPGGVIIYETFLIDQHRQFGKPGQVQFCWGHNELLEYFREFRILFYNEGRILSEGKEHSGEGTWVAQLIAERKDPKTSQSVSFRSLATS